MDDKKYGEIVNYALSKREDPLDALDDDSYYYPNMCHVCHVFDKNEDPLKRCSRCNMISYCGRQHQKQDWRFHKDLCKVVSEMMKNVRGSSIFAALKKTVTWNASTPKILQASMTRMNIKAELTKLACTKLDRYLDAYEIEMFDHPRVCAVCFESDPSALTNCQKCPQSSFCKKHLGDPKHAKICSKIKMSFLVETNRKLFHGLASSKRRPETDHQTESINLPDSIEDFIDYYIKIDQSCKKNIEIWSVYVSELITRPLTLLYAMEILELKPGSKLVTHVIGADLKELVSSMWEVILHWLPDLKDLTIILIGPEMIDDEAWLQEICKFCIDKEKKLLIKVETTLYEKYCKSNKFLKPDIIIAYNACINSNRKWTEGLLALSKISCPFVLTVYHALEAFSEQEKMQFLFGDAAKYLCYKPNPFANLLSTRLPADEGIYSDNEFLIIYNDLHKANNVKEVTKGKKSLATKD